MGSFFSHASTREQIDEDKANTEQGGTQAEQSSYAQRAPPPAPHLELDNALRADGGDNTPEAELTEAEIHVALSSAPFEDPSNVMYSTSPANVNACPPVPPGDMSITTESDYESAAMDLEKNWDSGEEDSDWPKRCYLLTTNDDVFYNRHNLGPANTCATTICEREPTPRQSED